MTYRDELLSLLEEELDISPKTVAGGIAQVIKGETVKEVFDGNEVLQKREVTRKAEDVLRGAMIYDALRGGDLGITPKSLSTVTGKKTTAVVHKRLAVDSRIIANHPDDEAIIDEPEVTLAEVFEHPIFVEE